MFNLHAHKPEKKTQRENIIHKIHIKQVRMVTQRDKMHGKREWEKGKQK